MCQAVDSRNHFFTSLLVCGGIILSSLAQQFQADWSTWFYYADALASIIIGLLILQSAVELTKELVKPDNEPAEVSHFVRSMQEKVRKKIVFDWLSQQLKDKPLTKEQLEERFTQQFCEQTPKILKLSGMGYCPESSADLFQHLDHFVKGKKLALHEGKYTF
jgi:hypothetical protein